MMQFTRFIRKVFATKFVLSGKFSFFLTLDSVSQSLSYLCRYRAARAAKKVFLDKLLCVGKITFEWTCRSQIQAGFEMELKHLAIEFERKGCCII